MLCQSKDLKEEEEEEYIFLSITQREGKKKKL
jgi:hypothetical protein